MSEVEPKQLVGSLLPIEQIVDSEAKKPVFSVSPDFLADLLSQTPPAPAPGALDTSHSPLEVPFQTHEFTLSLQSYSQVFVEDNFKDISLSVRCTEKEAASTALVGFVEAAFASKGIPLSFSHGVEKTISAGEHLLEYQPQASLVKGQDLTVILLKGVCKKAAASTPDPQPLAESPILPLCIASVGHPIYIGVQSGYCCILLISTKAVLRSLQTDPTFQATLRSRIGLSIPAKLGLEVEISTYPAASGTLVRLVLTRPDCLSTPGESAASVARPLSTATLPDRQKELILRGNEFVAKERWDDALKVAEELILLSTTSAMGQAFLFRALVRVGSRKYELAVKEAQKAVTYFRKAGMKFELGLALSTQARSEKDLNHDTEAIRLFGKLLKIAEGLDTSEKEDLQSRALFYLAQVHRRQNNGREASRYSISDAILTLQAGRSLEIARAASNMELAFDQYDEPIAAALLNQVGMAYAELTQDITTLHVALINGGVVQFRAGLFDKALEYAQRSLGLGLTPEHEATASLNCGEALTKLKRFDEALSCYRRALEAVKAGQLDIPDLSAAIYFSLGRCQEYQGSLDPTPDLERSLSLLLRLGIQSGNVANHFRRQSSVYQAALHHLVRYAVKSPATVSQGFEHIYNYTSPILLHQLGGKRTFGAIENCRIVYWPLCDHIHVWVQLPLLPVGALRYFKINANASQLVARLDEVDLELAPAPRPPRGGDFSDHPSPSEDDSSALVQTNTGPLAARLDEADLEGHSNAVFNENPPSSDGDLSTLVQIPILELLYDELIRPLQTELETYERHYAAAKNSGGAPKLVIAAYGDLTNIPFASLVDGVSKQPLFRSFAICRPPSLAVFDKISGAQPPMRRSLNATPVAVVVNDVNLQAAAEEANIVKESIAHWYRSAEVLRLAPLADLSILRSAAVVAAIKRCSNAAAAVLHVAAHHGVIGFDEMEQGGIMPRVEDILTPEQLQLRTKFGVQRSRIYLQSKDEIQPEDKRVVTIPVSTLWPMDLDNLDMANFALAFLNCCDSYHGFDADEEQETDEPQNPVEPELGFSSVLLANKVGAVVSTLWPVNDRDAKEFASLFYREWKPIAEEGKVDAAEALRRAQCQAFDLKLSWRTIAAYSISGLGL